MISVIIPTYNSAEYIAETLESVCTQTYRNIEILVIDDGKAVQRGSHEKLIDEEGLYAKLWKTQAKYYQKTQ